MNRIFATIARVARDAADAIVQGARIVARWVASTARALWERHQDLMADRPTYRAQLLAASAALLALLDPPVVIITAIVAVVGLYVASYGTQPSHEPTRDEPRWSPPTPKRLYDLDWE